jgi:uncharacterized LabA/DUF88 family protein
MSEYCYVDNSNVFIEGQRVAAVRSGMALDIWDAIQNRTQDTSYRLDFGKLHTLMLGGDHTKISRAVLFGSRPPPNDDIWNLMRRIGFEVIVEDRNAANKEKRIDTGIAYAMTKDAYTRVDKASDRLTLVAGDGDYVPVVRDLVAEGFDVDVAFWSQPLVN